MPTRRRPAPKAPVELRRNAVRVSAEIAVRLRAGHPWIFRDALAGRLLSHPAGTMLDILDPAGAFVGRALYDPDGPIALRVATRRAVPMDRAYLEERIRHAQGLRQRLLPEGVSAYRVFAGESEGLPGVAVDGYGGYLLAQYFTEAALHFAPLLYDTLEAVYQPAGIYEQRRLRPLSGQTSRGPAELVRGSAAPLEVEVTEAEARFGVDLTAPQNVGLFPDLRDGRAAVRRFAAGKRVLNLFSYTGAFSVAAALGGAAEIVSIDLAAKAHARARRNFERSGQDPERGKEYFVDDVAAALTKLAGRGRLFDLVVCDPPSFSQAKGRVFAASRDWAELVHTILTVLAPEGLLVACSNTGKLLQSELEHAIGMGAARAQTELRIVSRIGLPTDFPVQAGFPEGHYLKCVVATR